MENIEIVLLKPSDWELLSKKFDWKSCERILSRLGRVYEKEITFSDDEWKERPANKNSMIFVATDGNNSCWVGWGSPKA